MKPRLVYLLTVWLGLGIFAQAMAQEVSLLPPRQRFDIQDKLLLERFETLLPGLMKESGLDCWLIICREYNEDPAFYSLMPAWTLSARRLTMLAFFLKSDGTVDRLSISPYNIGQFYKGVWKKGQEEQWPALVRVIKERDPKRIGVNRSHHFAHADGLSAYLEKELLAQLPKKLAKRVCDADSLAVRWLETRLPAEEEHFSAVVAWTRALTARAYSREVITPGVTTTDDVQWWMREEMDRAGVRPWFFPDVDRKGRIDEAVAASGIIMPGDFLHCDVGVVYMGLCSDVQELAYVCAPGENDAPDELKIGLKAANDFQDLVMGELKLGLTGNEILANSLAKAKESIPGACLYTHPVGLHGHAAGPTIGMWDNQGRLPGHGEWPLFANTAYALELNVTRFVPGWSGKVRFGLEQDIWVTAKENRYLAGRQTEYHLIK